MSPTQRRIKSCIDLIGDTILVDGTPTKAVVALLARGTANSLMPTGDVDISTRPMRLAYVAFDDASVAGNAVVWDGLTFVLRKVISARLRDETVVKMLALG